MRMLKSIHLFMMMKGIPEDAEDEWDMIEEVFNSFMVEDEEDENSQDMD